MKNLILQALKQSKIFGYKLYSIIVINKAIILLIFLNLLFAGSSSSQNCDVKILAKNNIESVNNEGRVYFLTIQNLSNEKVTLMLSASNFNSGKNPDESESTLNVALTATILSETGDALEKISLGPNEIVNFQIKISVPQNTSVERWNSMSIIATSGKCPEYSSSILLYTFIPDPEEK